MALTLSVAVFLGTLGGVAWLLGTLLDYQGVAVIGSILVVGLGAAMTGGGGLQYASGEIQTENVTDVDVENEELVASPSEWQLLEETDLVSYSETVEYYNTDTGEWDVIAPSDYEMDYQAGAIQLTQSVNVEAGDDVRVSYQYKETETVVKTQFSEWEPPRKLPLDYLTMLLGATLMLRSLDVFGSDSIT